MVRMESNREIQASSLMVVLLEDEGVDGRLVRVKFQR